MKNLKDQLVYEVGKGAKHKDPEYPNIKLELTPDEVDTLLCSLTELYRSKRVDSFMKNPAKPLYKKLYQTLEDINYEMVINEPDYGKGDITKSGNC